MKVLHLLSAGNIGGIETLLQKYSLRSKLDNVFVFVWGGGDVYKEMQNCGIPCINLEEKRGKFYHTVKRILDVCKQEKPDVVIAHHAAPQFKVVISCLSVLIPQIKTVTYAHANGNDIASNGNRIKSFVNKVIHKCGFRKAKKVIAISESVKDSLTEVFSVPSNKISVIYNGTDTSRFVPNFRMGMHNPVRLVYVGRLIEEKGVQTTLQILSQLPKDYNWTFDIVGDGIYREFLEDQVKSLDLTKNVCFLRSRKDIPELLKKHDIFIHMPEWEEGFGIAIIEAMSAGLLCICRAKGGIPEIISNGIDGILVYSEEDLTNVLKRILTDANNQHLINIREKAHKKAQEFSIEHFTEQLDATILKL